MAFRHGVAISFVAVLALVAARPALAAVGADTVRAGRCSDSAMAAPDTNAKWFRVLRAWSRETPGSWSNDSLRTTLLELARRDQAVRRGLNPQVINDSALLRRMTATDSGNAARMRTILDRYGWPGKSMVGVRGENAAFLLVQHSSDLGPKGLALMQAAKPGEVSPADLALVIDRQRTSAGRPQVYGSQLDSSHRDVWPFLPIEDPAHVDERRANAGLAPLRAYACAVARMYKAAVVLPRS